MRCYHQILPPERRWTCAHMTPVAFNESTECERRMDAESALPRPRAAVNTTRDRNCRQHRTTPRR